MLIAECLSSQTPLPSAAYTISWCQCCNTQVEYSLATTSPIAACREEGATNGFIPQTLMCVLQQNRRCLGPVLTCSSIEEWLHDGVLLAMGIHAL